MFLWSKFLSLWRFCAILQPPTQARCQQAMAKGHYGHDAPPNWAPSVSLVAPRVFGVRSWKIEYFGCAVPALLFLKISTKSVRTRAADPDVRLVLNTLKRTSVGSLFSLGDKNEACACFGNGLWVRLSVESL